MAPKGEDHVKAHSGQWSPSERGAGEPQLGA